MTLPPVPNSRVTRSSDQSPASSTPGAIVDHGFIPVRAKLIEVAAFLDRVERHAAADDFRLCGIA